MTYIATRYSLNTAIHAVKRRMQQEDASYDRACQIAIILGQPTFEIERAYLEAQMHNNRVLAQLQRQRVTVLEGKR